MAFALVRGLPHRRDAMVLPAKVAGLRFAGCGPVPATVAGSLPRPAPLPA